MNISKMKYPNFKYVDTASNGWDRRNNPKIIPFSFSEKNKDAGRTYFRFQEDYLTYYKTHLNKDGKNTVGGYQGICYTDFIPIDIDRNGDIQEALKATQGFIQWLTSEYDVPIDSIPCWFSGNKGFHLAIPILLFGDIESSDCLPDTIKTIVGSFGDHWGLDPTVYDINRLWRAENTIHSKSGLYKVRIRNILNTTIDEVLKAAKSPGEKTSLQEFYGWNSVTSLVQLFNESENKVNGQKRKKKKTTRETFSNAAKELGSDVEQGRRNEVSFEIARHLRYQGLSKEFATPIMLDWNTNHCKPPLDHEELQTVIKSIFSSKAQTTHKKVTFSNIQNAIHSYLKLDKNSDYLIDLALSVPLSLRFDHVVWLMIIAPSSTGKTEILRLFRRVPDFHYLFNITAKTLFSGHNKAKGGFIPREIGDRGILCFPDFTTVLSVRPDDRHGIFNQLRVAYDGMAGRGTGIDEGEMPHWEGKVAFIGGVTNAIERYKSRLTDLGERFIYYKHPTPLFDESYLMMEEENIEDMRDRISYLIRVMGHFKMYRAWTLENVPPCLGIIYCLFPFTFRVAQHGFQSFFHFSKLTFSIEVKG